VQEVRDEFAALVADVQRRATVQALRQQHGSEGAWGAARSPTSALAAALAGAASPLCASYSRAATLCRPHWLPAPVKISPAAVPLEAEPTVEKHGGKSPAVQQSEQAASAAEDASSAHASDADAKSEPAVSSRAVVAAAAGPISASSNSDRSLDVQILCVHAAIRQRLLVSQSAIACPLLVAFSHAHVRRSCLEFVALLAEFVAPSSQ